MNIGVVGSRTFDNVELLEKVLQKYFKPGRDVLVSGGAPGADTLAELWAKDNDITPLIHPAEWDKYGKSAGHRRNKKIVRDSDAIIAFWDGESTGTHDTIKLAEKKGLGVLVVYF